MSGDIDDDKRANEAYRTDCDRWIQVGSDVGQDGQEVEIGS